MDMILRQMPFDDFNVFVATYFSDQIPDSIGHATFQNWFTILRDPHQMQVDHEYGMRSMAVSFHESLLS
jgi:hypothetical protein